MFNFTSQSNHLIVVPPKEVNNLSFNFYVFNRQSTNYILNDSSLDHNSMYYSKYPNEELVSFYYDSVSESIKSREIEDAKNTLIANNAIVYYRNINGMILKKQINIIHANFLCDI